MDNGLIGKKHRELEKEFGFDYYLETKDEFLLGRKLDSGGLINAFLKFNGEKTLKVVKSYGGVIQAVTFPEFSYIKRNLLLLAEKKGMFYDASDDELVISYGFLCEDYFAEIMEGIIFFSGKEESVHSFAEILDSFKIDYHEPYNILEEKEAEEVFRKLGRNEPCHCGSGKKYKKCCLEKDLKETGKPKKVKAAYY